MKRIPGEKPMIPSGLDTVKEDFLERQENDEQNASETTSRIEEFFNDRVRFETAKDSIEVFEKKLQETMTAYKSMLERLPEDKRLAYEKILKEDLYETYYKHYAALYTEINPRN